VTHWPVTSTTGTVYYLVMMDATGRKVVFKADELEPDEP
jgi:hypothetical protein